jgi:cellulose synthase A
MLFCIVYCQLRVSALLTNGAYVLNLDYDHCVTNSGALREAMCFLMDPVAGNRTCFVQFPLRVGGDDDGGDRHASRDSVFFDVRDQAYLLDQTTCSSLSAMALPLSKFCTSRFCGARQIDMKCLDGIQGPVYVGSGCFFNRKALYGFDPALDEDDDAHGNWCCFGNGKGRALRRTMSTVPLLDSEDSDERTGADSARTRRRLRSYHAALERHFGHSPAFIASAFAGQGRSDGGGGGGSDSTAAAACSLLREAIHVVSCAYEERTRWGKDVGWMYGTGGGGVATGFRMHARGWASAYCAPARTAFRTFARPSPSDVLAEASRRAVAAMGVLLSRHCPVWAGAGGRMRLLQRLGYATCVATPLASLPLTAYCALPAACLLTGRSIFPDDVSYYDAVLLILLLSSVAATAALELRWSRVTLRAWWRDQKLWVVTGTSACLAAVFQGILRACAGIDVGFSTSTETAIRSSSDDEGGGGEETSDARRSLRWSNLLIPPASLLLGNLAGVVVAVSYGVDHGYRSWGPVLGKLALAGWVVAHLQGFLRGLLARRDRAPTIAVLWSVLFVSALSLLWVNVDSYSAPPGRSTSQQPVL